MKFHNGEEFDADDVVFTLNFVSKPDSKVRSPQNVSWIDRAEKLGKHKVRIVSKTPFPAAIEYSPVPSASFRTNTTRRAAKGMNEKPVGSGPYRVAEHAIGKYTARKQRRLFSGQPEGAGENPEGRDSLHPDRQTRLRR